jgi:B12-binding domain/radical SAM domain protein
LRFQRTDLVLLHPPSVYDFRKMLLPPRPIADLVPSGALFEMFPIGFSFLGEYLERNGMKVRVANLAVRMLEEPRFDPARFIARTAPRAFGVGFHWLPHAQGALQTAKICKREHPDVPVIMGGYSATLFHQELMEHPEVDYVVRGDSGEEPLLRLMQALAGDGDVSAVPNLTYRDESGRTVSSELSWVPADLSHLGANYLYMIRSAIRNADYRGVRAFKGWWSYPVAAVLTVKGCTRSCTFCGGSAYAMKNCFGRTGIALRKPSEVAADLASIASFTSAPVFVIGDIRQPGEDYANEVLERLSRTPVKNHVVLELFEPAGRQFFSRAAAALPNFDIELSCETHDEEIRRRSGKPYSNAAIEECIGAALAAGCSKFDLFFMIGLAGQDPASVMDTVSWCDSLLAGHGRRLNPLIGVLAPFLDPGSLAREEADSRGYRVLLHTLDDHVKALLEPHWRDLLGYETDCMSRQDIVDATYRALRELNRVKAKHGQIDATYASEMEGFLDDNVAMLDRLDRINDMDDAALRDAELATLKKEADSLRARGELVKEELTWPLEGPAFRYGSIAMMLLKGRRAT